MVAKTFWMGLCGSCLEFKEGRCDVDDASRGKTRATTEWDHNCANGRVIVISHVEAHVHNDQSAWSSNDRITVSAVFYCHLCSEMAEAHDGSSGYDFGRNPIRNDMVCHCC